MMQKLQSTINFQELNDWINDVYWFEDKLKAKTGKDKIKDLNMKKVERIRAMLEWWVPTPEDWWQLLQNNQQPNVWQNTWVPMTDKDEEAWSTIEDIAIQDKQPEPEII
jgi:hypothetical protein